MVIHWKFGWFYDKSSQFRLNPGDAILPEAVGLYLSKPHETGLIALMEVRDTREEHTISTNELLRMVDFVLKNNFFEFNGQIKQQIPGAAMVPSLPHLACVCW